ncbi:MAG: glycosyltransferase family 39 protein [Ignavibacteria bacterium]|nr:glycosyltransferase family 39 protein [Ignavibacteria bacterium]
MVALLLTSVKIFGYNLLLLNIFVSILGICTAFFLYKFCKNIGFSPVQSFLFALLTLLGPATIMYSRPPDSEIIGMLMLSLSLLFLSKSIFSEKNQILYKFLFLFSLIITSLSKESFLILTPAVLVLYLWLYHFKNNTGIIQTIKKNYILLILSSVLFIILVILLVNSVGVSREGSHNSVNIRLLSFNILSDFIDTVFKKNLLLISFLGLLIFFENELQKNSLSSDYIRKHIKNIVIVIILALLIIVPQFIIYYRSGFVVGRYYLPYLLGYSFLIIYILKIIFDSKSISSFSKYIYLFTIIAYLFIEVITISIPEISAFSKICRENTQVINFLRDSPDKKLLIVFDPAQQVYQVRSLKIYLDYLNVKKDFKYEFIKKEKINIFFSDTTLYNGAKNFALKLYGDNLIDSKNEKNDISTILILQGLDNKFIEMNKHWFIENNYIKIKLLIIQFIINNHFPPKMILTNLQMGSMWIVGSRKTDEKIKNYKSIKPLKDYGNTKNKKY